MIISKLLKRKKVEVTDIHAPCLGTINAITELKDGVFSEKVLGDGFYITPQTGEIFSPIHGKVLSVFPTKHAITLQSINDDSVLLHMGVDTVELEGIPFSIFVAPGDKVNPSTHLATIDLDMLENSNVGNEIITVFPETDKLFELFYNDDVKEFGIKVGKLD